MQVKQAAEGEGQEEADLPAMIAYKPLLITCMCSGSEAGSYLRLIDFCISYELVMKHMVQP